MVHWPGNQACQNSSSIASNSILNIMGAIQNETNVEAVKFQTEGTND